MMHMTRKYCGCWVMTNERRQVCQVTFCEQHMVLSARSSVHMPPVERDPPVVDGPPASPAQPVKQDNTPPDSL